MEIFYYFLIYDSLFFEIYDESSNSISNLLLYGRDIVISSTTV